MPNIPFFLDQERENLPGNNVLVTQPVGFTVPPPASEWTWANQGTANAYDDPNGIKFVVGPDDTGQVCVFLLGDIPDSPYTITIAMPYPTLVGASLAIVLLDDISGMFKEVLPGSLIYWDDYATIDAFVTVDSNVGSGGGLGTTAVWNRVQDDGTNLIISTSPDGLFFQVITITPRTNFVIPTKYGIGMQAEPTVPSYPQIFQPYLLSFELTTP